MDSNNDQPFSEPTAVVVATPALAGAPATGSSTPPFLEVTNREVRLGGRGAADWAQELGLPFHLYYRPDIRRNVQAFRALFDALYPKGEIRFAGKACTHPEIFRTVATEGAGIDVASPFETRCALQAGVPAPHLDLNGNCKQDAEIEQAIALDMLIVVDNAEELRLVDALAAKGGRRPRALLRLAGYDLGPVTASAVFTAGRWTKFGIPIADLPAVLQMLATLANVRVLGYHTHIGTQITEPEAYLAVLQTMLGLREPLLAAGGAFEMVNLGGGFPNSYVSAEEWSAFVQRVREGLQAAAEGDLSKVYVWDNGPGGFEPGRNGRLDLGEWKGEKFYTPFPKERMLERILRSDITIDGRAVNVVSALKAAGSPTLVVEPGRGIVGDAAVTVTRVAHVRTVAGGHALTTVETGVTNYAEGMVSTPVRPWALLDDPARCDPLPFETFIGGNLCFSGDMLSRVKVPLKRRPVRGELILIPATGAYNPSFFASNANSFPRPSRVLVDADGSWRYLKTRDTYESLFT